METVALRELHIIPAGSPTIGRIVYMQPLIETDRVDALPFQRREYMTAPDPEKHWDAMGP
jgi:hypothetical protein